MVRNASTLSDGRPHAPREDVFLTRSVRGTKCVAVAGLVAVLLLNAGCLEMDKRSWFSSKPEAPPPAAQMNVLWYKQIAYIPDPTRNGMPQGAIAGRMYLFGNDPSGLPIAGDGKVTVEVFDDAKPITGESAKPINTIVFPKEILPRLIQKDMLKGAGGYTLLLPCKDDLTRIHIVVRFDQANGGSQLTMSSGP